MKKILFVTMLLALGGCKGGVNRILWGPDSPETPAAPKESHALITVACCKDQSGGVTSWPSFLPPSHVQLCLAADAAVRRNERIDGKTYLPMSVDCGHGHNDIGDEYYPPSGY